MSHDYEPEWDYEVLSPSTEVEEILASVLDRVRSQVLPSLRMDDIRTFFALLGGPLGLYVDGTSSLPVIGIDHDAILAACREHDLPYEQQLEATIMHEIGHAYQETMGIEHPDEDAVERFAHRWITEGVLDIHLLSLPEQDASCPDSPYQGKRPGSP